MFSPLCLFVCLFVTYEIFRFRKYIDDFRPLFVCVFVCLCVCLFVCVFVCVCLFVCLFVGMITRERKKLPMQITPCDSGG